MRHVAPVASPAAPHRPDAARAYAAVAHLEGFYPGFEAWFWGKVVPGLGRGTRWLRVVERAGEVVGVAIGKAEDGERKLCTVWVHPRLEGSGLGVRLIREGCAWLGTDQPLATVPEELMPRFAPILERLGFAVGQVLDGHYRPGKREVVFNGLLSRAN